MLHAVRAAKSNKLSPPSTCLRNNLAGVAFFSLKQLKHASDQFTRTW